MAHVVTIARIARVPCTASIPMKRLDRSLRLAAALSLSSALLAACAQPPMTTAAATPNPAALKELKAFPATLAGHVRHVIELPALPDEDERKLELMGGKAMTVDCNSRGMDGRFEPRDVQGWGYTYWVLQSRGQGAHDDDDVPAGQRQARLRASRATAGALQQQAAGGGVCARGHGAALAGVAGRPDAGCVGALKVGADRYQ